MSESIEYWQQSNTFTVTLRGHHQDLPWPEEDVVLQSEFDPVEYKAQQNDISVLINTIEGNDNYNPIYDSFYVPTDCKLSALTFRLPQSLPEQVEYKIYVKINGAEIELFPIPELELDNYKIYSTECDLHIWEDDFVEISVDFGSKDSWDKLTFNDHNMIVGFAGCVWYEEYKSIFPGGTKSWDRGDAYYKTNITLQNRSGNDIFVDRIFADIVKSPVSFLIQGIRLSMFEDELMTDDKLPRTGSCFYVDLLVNGRSVNVALNLPTPVALDSLVDNLRSFNSIYNNVYGYPVIVGDDIIIKIYQRNTTAKYNSKIVQANLFGCSSDCLTLINDAVTVYELCGQTPCEKKFSIDIACDPNKTKATPNKSDPKIKVCK